MPLEIGQLSIAGEQTSIDFMAKAARAAAITKHHQLQLLRPYLLQPNALDVPDFSLNISLSAFHATRTTAAAAAAADNETVSYQSLSMATRPRIVTSIRDRIVYLGQARRRFAGLAGRVIETGDSLSSCADLVWFSDPVNEAGLSDNGLLPSIATSNRLELITISGPRHIGKSHIMLQVAALFASEPSVVVLYIGSCKQLVFDAENEEEGQLCEKYIQFIEHVVCSFVAAYPDVVSRVADRWYRATRMGTDLSAMGVATSVFMRELSELCANRGITMLLFLDEYEALKDVDPVFTVVNVGNLIERLGVIVVASTTTCTAPVKRSYQCVVTAALTPDEAMNVFIATYGHLDISDAGLERLFETAEYHPLDIVRMLSQYEDKRAQLGNTNSEEDIISSLISDALLSRKLRISQMHLHRLHDALATGMQSTSDNDTLVYEGVGREIISVDQSPHLFHIKRETTRAAFAIYHGLDLKHCSGRDLQFAEPEPAPTPATSSHHYSRQRTTPKFLIRCFPPIAAEIMYDAHFAGQTAEEQFGWLLLDNQAARTHFDVEPRVRLRYFDALLLESGRLRSSRSGTLDLQFTHVRSFTCQGSGRRIEPRLCLTFEQASNAIAEYIAVQRANNAPLYVSTNTTDTTSKASTIRSAGSMLYFPKLGFGESWMSAEIRSNSHFEGSFMAAVVRVDRLVEGTLTWGLPEFQVTWIASDPLCPASSSSSSTSAQRRGGIIDHKAPPPVPPSSNMDIEPPKDVEDFDASFGVGGSWTVKALRILPDIQQLMAKHNDFVDTRPVGMLAVTTDERYAEIASRNDLGISSSAVVNISSLGQRLSTAYLQTY
ncbi:hypothetical protein GGI21_000350 [Coemansia aciculifera]|uniref:Uncharacterized protein n=1 Tax=Coemansia aciculifera TaxID=417176 RepID=A0ACC1M8I0_9FUNG|nr:hypothetical protein IWW38_001280 [Coemansia aciculifera]KAJ2910927.1 hypothetical protein GGI21_000350 [Coemansia aciculifera]